MEFSEENLQNLLNSAKTMTVLAEVDRERLLASIPKMNEEKKRTIFESLLESEKEIEDAEQEYNEKAQQALTEYTGKISEGQNNLTKTMREKMEEFDHNRDEKEQEKLLTELDQS